MAVDERWQRARARILAKHREEAHVLTLPEQIGTPRLDPRDLVPSPYFTGRAETCARLRLKLMAALSVNIHALHGIGGIGKSEIAKQVALRLEREGAFPDGCIWISLEASPRESVWATIADRFDVLGLGRITQRADQLDIVHELLDAVSPLVVLDNADNPESLRVAYEAVRGKTVLVTSRQACTIAIDAEDLDDLPIEDAADLYSAIVSSRAPLGGDAAWQRQVVKEIVQRLSGHPLSIEILAAKATRYAWAPERTLEELRRRGIDALSLPRTDAAYRTERHRATAKTFELALSQDLEGADEIDAQLGRALYSACSALCADHFYFEEIFKVLETCARLYQSEAQEVVEARARAAPAEPNQILVALGLADAKPPAPPPDLIRDPDSRGIAECLRLLQPEVTRQLVDELVALRLLKATPGEGRARYRFHPLLREFAWGQVAEHFGPRLWKAVVVWNARKAQELEGQLGDQVENLAFFVSVCQQYGHLAELVVLLRAVVPHLVKDGHWGRALELLALGQKELPEQTARQADRAWVLSALGGILWSRGEIDAGRDRMLEARAIYDTLGRTRAVLDMDVRSPQTGNMAVDTSTRFRIVRESAKLGSTLHYSSVLMELWRTGVLPCAARSAIEIAWNIKRYDRALLLDVIAYERLEHTDFEAARMALQGCHRLLEEAPSAEVLNRVLESECCLALYQGDYAGADALAEEYRVSMARMGDGRAEELIHMVRAERFLVSGDYARARENIDRARRQFPKATLHMMLSAVACLLQTPPDVAEVDRLCASLREAQDDTPRMVERGLGGARILLGASGDAPTCTEALRSFRRACHWLARKKRIEQRYLEMVRSAVVRRVGEEAYYGTSGRLGEGADLLSKDHPSRSPHLRVLPTMVRKQPDGRLLRLVPGGLATWGGCQTFVPAFYVDVHPVTVADYKVFVNATGHAPPARWDEQLVSATASVTGIDLADARAYCVWAIKTLPTSLELERSAVFFGGDDPGVDERPMSTSELAALFGETGRPHHKSERLENLLTASPRLFEKEAEGNPYEGAPSWSVDGISADFCELLDDSVWASFCRENLLNWLSASAQLNHSVKEAVLERAKSFSMTDVEELLAALHGEIETYQAMEPKFWPTLQEQHARVRQEWVALVRARVDARPKTNPELETVVWNHGISGAADPGVLIGFHEASFDEDEFLTLLAGAHIPIETKEATLLRLPSMDQAEVREMMSAFVEARQERSEAPRHLWGRLKKSRDKALAEWFRLISRKLSEQAISQPLSSDAPSSTRSSTVTGARRLNDVPWPHLDMDQLVGTPDPRAHPMARTPACDVFLPEGVDIREILPPHPETRFPEREFLQLLGRSISLTKEEKLRIVVNVAQLGQAQVDELVRIFSEEWRNFFSFDERYWPELTRLCDSYMQDWIELVTELHPAAQTHLLPLVDPTSTQIDGLDGQLWHWTESLAQDPDDPIAVGGRPVGTTPAPTKLATRRLKREHRAGNLGFRCAIPIFSESDLQNLEVVTMPDPTTPAPSPSLSTLLAAFVKKRRPVLWVGAGLSVAAGIPSTASLAQRLWDEHGMPGVTPDLSDPFAAIDAFHQRYGKGTLDQALSHLVPPNAQPTEVHGAIAQLARAGAFSMIITTNYDRLLETALSAAGVAYLPQVLADNQELRDEGRLRLIKLHGDLQDWRSTVLTGESYRTFAKRYALLEGQLSLLLLQSPLLFLGCSMLDERILGWIEALPEQDRSSLKHWIAVLTTEERRRLDNPRGTRRTAATILGGPHVEILEVPDHAAIPVLVHGALGSVIGT